MSKDKGQSLPNGFAGFTVFDVNFRTRMHIAPYFGCSYEIYDEGYQILSGGGAPS